MTNKTCTRCKETKPLTQFYKNMHAPDGKCNQCITCRKEIKKKHRTKHAERVAKRVKIAKKNTYKRGREYVYDYLLKHPCVKCGETDIRCLEFNHIDPSIKTNQVSNMLDYSLKRIQEEIDKCEVLCCNCHRIHTYKDSHKEKYLSKLGILP